MTIHYKRYPVPLNKITIIKINNTVVCNCLFFRQGEQCFTKIFGCEDLTLSQLPTRFFTFSCYFFFCYMLRQSKSNKKNLILKLKKLETYPTHPFSNVIIIIICTCILYQQKCFIRKVLLFQRHLISSNHLFLKSAFLKFLSGIICTFYKEKNIRSFIHRQAIQYTKYPTYRDNATV